MILDIYRRCFSLFEFVLPPTAATIDCFFATFNNTLPSIFWISLWGIWAMIAVFLAYCLLQAPSTLLTQQHPVIWRLVHGMAVIYLVILTFLPFQVGYLAKTHIFFY